jgi:hypothetical protein
MAAYYALHHPPERVRIYAYHASDGDPRGFIAVAQTGIDLFRPLVIPFVASKRVLIRLLIDALRPEQAVLISLPTEQAQWLEALISLEHESDLELLRMEAEAFEPVLNVLVVENEGPDGLPRYEIQTVGRGKVAAGVNWISGKYADVYVDAPAGHKNRALTKSVLSALCGRLLGERRIALFRVETSNLSARTDAFNVGFRPTGRQDTLLAGSLLPQTEQVDRK